MKHRGEALKSSSAFAAEFVRRCIFVALPLLQPLTKTCQISSLPSTTSIHLQGIRNCNIGMSFSDEDLALLFCKYDRSGEFNYYRFCRDMEAAERK